MTKTIKVDSRNRIILRLNKQGLTLGEIKLILKGKYGAEISREMINRIIKGRFAEAVGKNKNLKK